MRFMLTAVVAASFMSVAANAESVSNTSLQKLNGNYGGGVATTTTTSTGTRTTVVGPDGSANRASGTATVGQWYQANVGGGGTVGITTDYSRDGNGAAYFSTTSGDSKGDLQYNIGSLIDLSTLTGVSFDFYRSSSSTTGAQFAPVMRLDIAKDGRFAGSLVFENLYQAQTNPPVDSWTTLTGNLNSGIFWATNVALGPTFASANGGQKTLAAWLSGNSGSNLSVYGLSIGVGSGWNNTFAGAVDNVSLSFASRQVVSSDFQVAAATGAVPEPAAWAMMILGMGAIGAVMRRKVRASEVTFDATIKRIAVNDIA